MAAAQTSAQLLDQGLFHHRRGELALAMERYVQVLRQEPENADALYYAAAVACEEGQFKEGIALARRSLEFRPAQARAHNLIGKAHDRMSEAEAAIAAYDAAIALDPDFAQAHGNRAATLAAVGRAAEALAGFDRALALDPKAAPDWLNRAALFRDLGIHENALESYDRALALVPDDPSALLGRADTLAILGRFAEAEAGYDAAIAGDPKLAVAHAHKAMAVKNQGRLAEARKLAEQALAIKDDEPTASFVLAQLLLLHGEWAHAWPLFDKREGLPRPPYLPLDAPRWQGEPPDDHRLVLMAEQGLGDTVQFARYASELAARGHKVTLLALPVLAPLLRGLAGVERVATTLAEIEADARPWRWLPLMSVMGALALTPESVRTPGPYLAADPQRAAAWAQRLGGRDGLKVGLVWRGSTARSAAPLAALAPLAEVDGLRLISLQKGPPAAESDQVAFGAGIERPLDATDTSAGALLDTAALMANLDAVVSIDSMPAHLAGALGRPVLLALPAVPDWRWLLGRADTPWYPGMRLFRQDTLGDWQGVFRDIAAALRTHRR